MADGDWLKGKAVFLNEGKCANCHRLHGVGTPLGPDLADLAYRDPRTVVRDIVDPNAAINPNFASYSVALRDGRVFSGFLRDAGPRAIRVVDAGGNAVTLANDEIEILKPSSVSMMPTGMKELLGKEKLQDLLAFLMRPPTTPPESQHQSN